MSICKWSMCKYLFVKCKISFPRAGWRMSFRARLRTHSPGGGSQNVTYSRPLRYWPQGKKGMLLMCIKQNPLLRTNLNKCRDLICSWLQNQKIYLSNQCHEEERTFFLAMPLGKCSEAISLALQRSCCGVCRGPSQLEHFHQQDTLRAFPRFMTLNDFCRIYVSPFLKILKGKLVL